ncbi:MAG TPA: AsmA-like C-terminal region-containing protein [Kiritimatiellia bacterium]
MKAHSKKSLLVPDGNTAQLPVPRRIARRAARRVARFFYNLFHHAWSIGIVVFCVLVYLWAIGLPEPVKQALLDRMSTGSFRLEVDRISIDPREGLVGAGVRLFEAGSDDPLFSAGRVGLDLSWLELVQRSQPLRVVRVTGGEITWPHAPRSSPIKFSGMAVEILFEEGAIRFKDMAVALFGVPLEGQGVVQFKAKPGFVADPWSELASVVEGARKSPDWLHDLCGELARSRHTGAPRGRVDFKLYPETPMSNEVAVLARGERTSLRGANLDGWDVEVRLKERTVAVSNLSVRVGGNTLHVGGTYDLVSRVVEGRIFSDIPAGKILGLVPAAQRKQLDRLGIEARDGMKTELWAGPVSIDELGRNFTGWMSLDNAELRGVPFVKFFASFRREGPRLSITSVKGRAGRGERSGLFEGALEIDNDTGAMSGTLDIACFPDDMIPVLNRHQAAFVRRFEFGNEPMRFTGTFADNEDTGGDLDINGRLLGTNLHYRGQFLASVDTTIAYGNGLLRLAPFELAREEGRVTGSLDLDFRKDQYDVDLRSTMDPGVVVEVVGPGLARGLSFLEFSGPARVSAIGRFDGKGDTNTDLRVDVSAERVAMEWFKADTCSVGVDAKGGRYTITNLAGTAFGGTFGGVVHVFPDTNNPVFRHAVDLTIEDAEFARLVAAFREGTNDLQGGRFACTLQVTGLAESNVLETLEGSGAVRIREGYLFTMPMLGGLSRWLSRIYPGLGFASQTDFRSDVTIGNNKVRMDNAMLGGAVLSVSAKGTYSFDRKLDFIVEVKPLRGGPLAAVLRLVTLPVTKLLTFDLGGTIDHPKWRPSNLPKELFLIFD